MRAGGQEDWCDSTCRGVQGSKQRTLERALPALSWSRLQSIAPHLLAGTFQVLGTALVRLCTPGDPRGAHILIGESKKIPGKVSSLPGAETGFSQENRANRMAMTTRAAYSGFSYFNTSPVK